MRLNVVGISGSLRLDSYNRKALAIAMSIVREAGAVINEIDLKTLNLPVYDGDIEKVGFPENVEKIRSMVRNADMILFATPEYNHSISGGLKNAIDWLSTGGENVLDGKVAAIFGVSSGLFGTLRAQLHLRQILGALNVALLPQPQVFIRTARDAFDENGSLKDQKIFNQLKLLIHNTMELKTKNKS
jgi:chromate reductase, NAD(P)H dehydrogenase (quinone)